jgi:CHAT domain-containing protein/tetratricopeptide (TPR) repeat protein
MKLKSRLFTMLLGLCAIGILGATSGLASETDRVFQQGAEQFQQNQIEAAIATWEKALAQYQQLHDNDAILTTQNNLGLAWQKQSEQAARQGQYKSAIDALQQAVQLAENTRNDDRLALLQGTMATMQKQLGNYAIAKQLNQSALDHLKTKDRPLLTAQILGNLGNVDEALGDYETALEHYQQSLKLVQNTPNRLAESIALGNLGSLNASLGKYKLALQFLQQSLEIARSIGNQPAQTSALINLGSAHHGLKDPEQAAQFYQQALVLAQATHDRVRESQAIGSLGIVAEYRRDFVAAIQLKQQSLTIAQSLHDPQLEGLALNNLGYTLRSAKKYAESEKVLRQALKLLDAVRPNLSDTYKVSIFDTQIQTYNLLQQVLVAANQPEQALEISEQSRARAFSELLAQRQGDKSTVQPITLSEIKRIAKIQQATLVEYSIVADHDFKFRGKQRGNAAELLIWVVQPTGQIHLRHVDLKTLTQNKFSLTKLVTIARCLQLEPLCPPVPAALGFTPNPVDRYPGLAELHQLLIAPIADLLPQDVTNPVVFVPHETLFLVPFAALMNAKNQPLIEQHTIAFSPSIQVLDLTLQRQTVLNKIPSSNRPILIVGNPDPMPEGLSPLPAAEKEAIAIGKLFGTAPLIGSQATETKVREILPQAKLIHFATHGLLEYAQLNALGTPGAIALAPDRQHDGLFSAAEILDATHNSPIKADLVVLSACDTGRGTITGDGVLGLSRAWIAAGTPNVIVSLWAVNDASTSTLMQSFYQNLPKNRANKAIALRQAMLETRKKYPSPLDWAAFTLFGASIK